VEDAYDVVDRSLIKRNPGVPALGNEEGDLLEAGIDGGRGDLGSRDHDGVGRGFLEVKDPVYHVRFFVTDEPHGLALVHEAMDFFSQIRTLDQVVFLSKKGFYKIQKPGTGAVFQGCVLLLRKESVSPPGLGMKGVRHVNRKYEKV
jgi:hypothetical protein